MKKFLTLTLCAASVVALFATTGIKAQTSDKERSAAFVGLRIDEDGQRHGLVGVANEIATRVIAVSRTDFGGTTNLTQEIGYQFSPTPWLHLMPFLGFGFESEVSTSPVTYITGATGIAASLVVDDFVGWGLWSAAKYTDGADSFNDSWQFGGGVWFGI